MELAHLDRCFDKGVQQSLSAITDYGKHFKTIGTLLVYSLLVQGICFADNVIFQKVVPSNGVFEEHDPISPSPIGRIHQDDYLSRFNILNGHIDEINFTLNGSLGIFIPVRKF